MLVGRFRVSLYSKNPTHVVQDYPYVVTHLHPETDVLRPELTAQYQGYGRMFEQLFSRQPIAAQFHVYNVMNGEYPPEGETFDAYR